jgi:phospholipid/cholesterol/gamma-HCH transport system substrate-binding protein
MDEKVNYAAVGAFVIGLGAALIVAVLWLASGGLGHRQVDLYQSLSNETVAGLSVDAPVKYRGVDVGKVKAITLVPDNPQQVRLLYEIDRGTPVKTDTAATLTTQGLTGTAYIELSGGSPKSPPLVASQAGDVPVIPTRPSLSARLEQVLTRVLGNVDRTSHTLDGVFTDENKKSLSTALSNVAALTQTLVERKGSIDAALRNADRTMANAAEASARLDATLGRIDKAADAFDAMSVQVDATAAGASHAIATVDSGAQRLTGETAAQLEKLMDDLSVLSASLRRLSEQTEHNPKSLLFGKPAAVKGPGE